MSDSMADGHWAKWLNVAGSLASLIGLGYVWHLFGPESRRGRVAGNPSGLVIAGLPPLTRGAKIAAGVAVIVAGGAAIYFANRKKQDDAALDRELALAAQMNPAITTEWAGPSGYSFTEAVV